AIGRNSHAIASVFIFPVPQRLVGEQIDAGKAGRRAEIKPAGLGAGADAFDRLGLLRVAKGRQRDAPHEAVIVVDIEDEYPDAAVLDLVADAGDADVEETARIRLRRLRGERYRGKRKHKQCDRALK